MPEQKKFAAAVRRWAKGNVRTFPWRQTKDPYRILIGEVLLQRTRGEHVVAVYKDFLRRWPNIDQFARARESTIASVIYPLGLAKRAPVLRRLGRALGEKGYVPDSPDELIELPGVGRYSAHAVPVFANDASLPLVDWVIARVLKRYFGVASSSRPNADEDLWNLAARLAAGGNARELWLGTLDFAAAICQPRPRCPECPLRAECHWAKSLGPASIGR